MTRLKSFGIFTALFVFSACSNDVGGCGGCSGGMQPTLAVSKYVLTFSNIGSAYSQTVTLQAPKGEDGVVT